MSDIKVYNIVTINLEGLAQDKSGDVTLPVTLVVGALRCVLLLSRVRSNHPNGSIQRRRTHPKDQSGKVYQGVHLPQRHPD